LHGRSFFASASRVRQHAAIVDPDVFEAVQTKLAEGAVAPKLRRAQSQSASVPACLLTDERGNAMTPSQANTKEVRYRYYVSQALLQAETIGVRHIRRKPESRPAPFSTSLRGGERVASPSRSASLTSLAENFYGLPE